MKNRALLPLSLAAALLLSGCSGDRGIYANYRAIEKLQTVQTFALDQGDSDGVTVTVSVDKIGDQPAAILCAGGGSIPLAIAALQDHAGRGQLFFAHTRYVLLGRGQAADGFGALLDYTERDLYTRMGAALFVLQDGRAADLLREIGDGDAVLAMLDAVRRDTELWGGSGVTDLRRTAVALSEYGAALVGALGARQAEDSAAADAPARLLIPAGYAVLKDGAAVDYLSGADAEAVGFLTGRSGTVTRCMDAPGGGKVTLALQCAGTEIRCERADSGLRFDITMTLHAVISGADGVQEPLTEGTLPADLERQLAAQTEADARRVLDMAQALDADFLALARQARLHGLPTPDGWLPAAQFRIQANTVIRHSNDLGEPLGTGGQNT